MRTTYDCPLWRSTIGFDRLLDLVDAAQQAGTKDNYPPCNVERVGEDRYQISLAVAGFITGRNRDHRRTKRPDGGRPESRENSANSCTREFRRGLSSGNSIWRTTFRSRERRLTMACSRSNWSASYLKP